MTPKDVPGGLLIAVEGIDGAGKTTLVQALHQWLSSVGAKVEVSKEPTQGPWGAKLREAAASGRTSAEDERRYLILDRKQHVAELIQPALRRNAIVVLDRYYPSMLAYQGAAGLDVGELLTDNAFAPAPDVLLLLDLDPALGLARIRARGDVPNHFETPDSLTAAREIFLSMDVPKVVIDAALPVEEVIAEAQKRVLLAIANKFRAGGRERDPEVASDVRGYLPAMAL